ncbi:Fibroblast growth factor 19 [Oryzias melastigma]|uniref:Fibroblast growth factor n=1 Tax=Oryzias melastigma TaxID=30732 RepID=A0A834CSM4_ORYME|nr:Fibroblast growth factor 19 [Oryzias melastigma]
MLLIVVTVSVASVFFASGVSSMPLSDHGPHITHSWSQVVRLRHLYAVKPGQHVQIREDGHIHGSAEQTLNSKSDVLNLSKAEIQCSCWILNDGIQTTGLLEISPVAPGRVVFRGVATSRFLCMESDGRLFSSHSFDKDNCIFREQILADGYNIYISDQHGTLLSLGNHRQRQQGLDRDVPALAQFLPRISTLQQTLYPAPDVPHQLRAMQTEKTLDAMDSFGQLSKIIHSPSFNKR